MLALSLTRTPVADIDQADVVITAAPLDVDVAGHWVGDNIGAGSSDGACAAAKTMTTKTPQSVERKRRMHYQQEELRIGFRRGCFG